MDNFIEEEFQKYLTVDHNNDENDLEYIPDKLANSIKWEDASKMIINNMPKTETPSLSKNSNSFVILFFSNYETKQLYYQVGKLETENQTTKWTTEPKLLGKGVNPKVHLTDTNHVILLYSDGNFIQKNFSKVYQRIGILNSENFEIEWASSPKEVCEGSSPSFCVNRRGLVALSYNSSNNNVECLIGIFSPKFTSPLRSNNTEKETILNEENNENNIENNTQTNSINNFLQWDISPAQMKNRTEASIVVTETNHIIVASVHPDADDLYFSVAMCSLVHPNKKPENNKTQRRKKSSVNQTNTFLPKEEVKFIPNLVSTQYIHWLEDYVYDTGCSPSLFIFNNDVIIETHNSEKVSSLWYHLCRFNTRNNIIKFRGSYKYDSGVGSTLIFLNESKIMEIHKSQFKNVLWTKYGEISFKEPYPYNLIYKASHNSCLVDINAQMPALKHQLEFGIQLIELDFFKTSFNYILGHKVPGDFVCKSEVNPNTFQLTEWLNQVYEWSSKTRPLHFPLFVLLDTKNSIVDDVLDDEDCKYEFSLNEILDSTFKDRMFTPHLLKEKHGGEWPKTSELRGKIIFILSGDLNSRISYLKSKDTQLCFVDCLPSDVKPLQEFQNDLYFFSSPFDRFKFSLEQKKKAFFSRVWKTNAKEIQQFYKKDLFPNFMATDFPNSPDFGRVSYHYDCID
eukprot:TRINITY_DN3839_c0_g1_i1.p1 TRINITY_DN3839_c0_g1~~TRINITY_DN3839_c0_g1_i1.p1  ORF type:complete len:681 (+),score=185.88 TRINITY_DN3839_c0_g1_i1:123-2165(+)